MLKLEKCVCALYICLAIIIGGIIGYYKANFNGTTFNKLSASKYEENSKDISIENKEYEQAVDSTRFIPIKAELTAYCNCAICSEAWGARTAMQTHTRIGVIAAPENIPLGSKIYIPSLKDYKEDGIFDVEDRGGAIKIKSDGTYIIDVWFQSHDEVEAFGRQKDTIYLVK